MNKITATININDFIFVYAVIFLTVTHNGLRAGARFCFFSAHSEA